MLQGAPGMCFRSVPPSVVQCMPSPSCGHCSACRLSFHPYFPPADMYNKADHIRFASR
jgi:hypothetical protein